MSDIEHDETIRDLEVKERRARIAKLHEEAAQAKLQRQLYPFVVFSGITVAVVAFINLFL